MFSEALNSYETVCLYIQLFYSLFICPFGGYSLSFLSSHSLMNLLHYFIHLFLGKKGPCLNKVHELRNYCLPQKPFFNL